MARLSAFRVVPASRFVTVPDTSAVAEVQHQRDDRAHGRARQTDNADDGQRFRDQPRHADRRRIGLVRGDRRGERFAVLPVGDGVDCRGFNFVGRMFVRLACPVDVLRNLPIKIGRFDQFAIFGCDEVYGCVVVHATILPFAISRLQ